MQIETDLYVTFVSEFMELYLNNDNGCADIHEIVWIFENHHKLPSGLVDEIAEHARELIDLSLKWGD